MNRTLKVLTALLAALVSERGFAGNDDLAGSIPLAQAFASPPASAKPFVHWYWQTPATPEKVTQDLEAMRAQGIQGARVYPYDLYMKPEWPPLFEHLLKEADRLGLQIHLNNDCSWSCKRLPWMTPEFAQKRIVHTTTSVKGGGTVHTTLPQPDINDPVFASYAKKFTPKGQVPPVNHYYMDVAALAVRTNPSRP
jgi:hypothetical protein